MKAIVVYDLIISQAALYSQRVKNERKSFFEQKCATKFEFETGFADLAKVLLEEGTTGYSGKHVLPLIRLFCSKQHSLESNVCLSHYKGSCCSTEVEHTPAEQIS